MMIRTIARSCRCTLVRAKPNNQILHSLQPRYQPSSTSNGARHFSNLNDRSSGPANRSSDVALLSQEEAPLGSKAFVDCDRYAIMDLFHKFAVNCDVTGKHMDKERLGDLLRAIGENPDEETIDRLFTLADENGDGTIELEEFLRSSDTILGSSPASIILVVGGPGSGKGLLAARLEKECGVVHLSSGELLRDEVRRGTVLGNQVRDIMARGELVSSAVIVTLVRRIMRNHPGKRVLLDGFPRSLQNAEDLIQLCGVPMLALHLDCDDTILIERIIKRGNEEKGTRDDDNITAALQRIRKYHKYHHSTMEWLREQHVPVVNLDCSGTAENVWLQLSAIGKLMRPVARPLPHT